jgi:hypothetical protein
MAWALDGIVAADVVPLDERHVAVLGYVLADDDNNDDDGTTNHPRNIPNPYEMELQIVDRTTGSILYSDLLQLERPNGSSSSTQSAISNFSHKCQLLSSFAIPRMDDVLELKEERGDYVIDMTYNSPQFVDSHLRWNLNMVSFPTSTSDEQNNKDHSKYDVDDNNSVDSDDYDFLINTTNNSNIKSSESCTTSAPIMLVISDVDVVLARVRDVDDAIHFALDHRRSALALFWALKYRTRQLRRYTMGELINQYLQSLLRITNVNTSANFGKQISKRSSARNTPKLSLRRMSLAAQSLPILLGGNVNLWKTWIITLEKIPGALFVVRKYIPVRGQSKKY